MKPNTFHKTRFLLVAFFVLLSFEKTEAHIHSYIFTGFNSSKTFSDLKNKEAFVSEAKSNFNFGGAIRFEFGKYFYLQPEFYFTRKGGLERSLHAAPFDSLGLKMLSLDMPIITGVRFFDNGEKPIALRLYTGPVISFLQQRQHSNRVTVFKDGRLLPYKQSTRVFSLQSGAGIDFWRFTFDVRYEHALSSIISFGNTKTKYRVIYFTLGLKIF